MGHRQDVPLAGELPTEMMRPRQLWDHQCVQAARHACGIIVIELATFAGDAMARLPAVPVLHLMVVEKRTHPG